MAALTGCLPSTHPQSLASIATDKPAFPRRWELHASSLLPGRRACPFRTSSCSASSASVLFTVSSSFEQEESLSVELEPIASQEEFDEALANAQHRSQPIIIDWMAAWCRKCIYLKPKLEKLASEFHTDVKFYCVDVNTVPQTLVKRADVTRMPTIQLWKDGEKCDEVIGGHQAWLVIEEVREMLQKHIGSSQ